MCLATPSKVIKIEKDWATVQSNNHQHKANLSLVKNVKIGDYLLIHDNLAINKVPKTEAKRILKIVNGLSK
ncbi:MAG: HypC/HybG/HupF family hydrogenase formation chaperone [Parcubacteria group bacterium]|nr:HypC/HybG/HupF family hydrogenase formation chaperone [Parcubacteria group bacterium]